MGRVLAGGREPLISRIKLAWWREALETLDARTAPDEPVLQALSAEVIPGGLSGAELAAMETGWSLLLREEPLAVADLDSYASARGGALFRLTGRLLGPDVPWLGRAGEAWALVDFARHSGSPDERGAALAAARSRGSSRRWPSVLRPLGMLAALAGRDAEEGRPQWEPQGSPRRMVRMLRHRFTGFSPF